MIIEPSGSSAFRTDFSGYEVVGFHATSMAACSAIETVGFLPHKVLGEDVHRNLLAAAKNLRLSPTLIRSYEEWLGLRSVTFTKKQDGAINHALSGRFGGQGLQHIKAILGAGKTSPTHQQLVADVQQELDRISQTGPVVYAVDLSNLGVRLVEADDDRDYLRIHFNPYEPLPTTSIVGPDRLIARLKLS